MPSPEQGGCLPPDTAPHQDHAARHQGVTAIHINLDDQAVELEDRHGTVARVDFGGATLRIAGPDVPPDRLPDYIPDVMPTATVAPVPLPAARGASIVPAPASEPVPGSDAPAEEGIVGERPSPITLVGRLVSAPRAGRLDPATGGRHVWARFAVAEAGQPEPREYLVTFGEQTAAVARGLRRDAQVILEGQVRASATPDQPNTFAVTTIVAQPRPRRRPAP